MAGRVCPVIILIVGMGLPGVCDSALANTASAAAGAAGPDATADATALLVCVGLTLLVSFLCSIAESVLLSVTPSYIEALRDRHSKRAARLKTLRMDKVDRSLAAILTVNTIANTAGSVIAGNLATEVFGSAVIGIFSAVMTLLILYVSEIIPKTIGAVYWPKLARIISLYVSGLIVLVRPFVWVSEGLTRLIARGKDTHRFSRAEFIAMASIGEKTGEVHEHESRIIKNLFRFGSLKTRDIMTPRTVILALPQDSSMMEAAETAMKSPFTRLPVYGRDMDDITGFVLKDEIVMRHLQGRNAEPLLSLKRDILCVPTLMPLSMLLESFLEHRQHIALVVDEYGGTTGLVTLENVVESLLGAEIMDEKDKVENMRHLARQKWTRRNKGQGGH